MQFTRFVFLLTFLITSFSQVNAQTSVKKFESLTSVDNNLLELEEDNWTFYNGENNNTYFLDFDKISSNLKEIQVFNGIGEVVFKDELWNLPVDSIYELDMRNYNKGKYRIVVKSFTDEITKSVDVI